MSDETIPPAMTPEEWERCAVHHSGLTVERMRDLFVGRPTRNLVMQVRGVETRVVEPQEAHALAALCLHQQPFGFTREELEFLRLVAGQWRALRLGEHQQHYFDRIAAKIGALLPPETPE